MGSPRIYAACLAAYNSGKLHGAWIDGLDDTDHIKDAIAVMIAASPEPGAEEYAIHDHEGFGAIDIGEHTDLDMIALHARMIEEHGNAWVAYVGNVGEEHAKEDGFQNAYAGYHKSPEDYAEQLHEDMGIDLGPLAAYVDWERYARDLSYDGYAFVPDEDGGSMSSIRSSLPFEVQS